MHTYTQAGLCSASSCTTAFLFQQQAKAPCMIWPQNSQTVTDNFNQKSEKYWAWYAEPAGCPQTHFPFPQDGSSLSCYVTTKEHLLQSCRGEVLANTRAEVYHTKVTSLTCLLYPMGWKTAMVGSHLRPCTGVIPKDSRGKRQYLGPEDFIEQNFYMRKNFSCFNHC